MIPPKGKSSEYMKYFPCVKHVIVKAFAGDCSTQSLL